MKLTFLEGQITLEAIQGGGDIHSVLPRIECPECHQHKCNCDQHKDEINERVHYNGALEGMERLLLALCSLGVIDRSEDAVINEALQTVIDALDNEL